MSNRRFIQITTQSQIELLKYSGNSIQGDSRDRGRYVSPESGGVGVVTARSPTGLFAFFRTDLIQSEPSWKLSSTSDWLMFA